MVYDAVRQVAIAFQLEKKCCPVREIIFVRWERSVDVWDVCLLIGRGNCKILTVLTDYGCVWLREMGLRPRYAYGYDNDNDDDDDDDDG